MMGFEETTVTLVMLLELLKTAPGVVVDPNENIQMGGKNGVTIMIDNRNTQLSATDLAQFFKDCICYSSKRSLARPLVNGY